MLRKLLFQKTNSAPIQFFRYGIVGAIAFVCDFSTLVALTEFLKIHYLISAAVGFIVGLTVNYILSVRWVFAYRKYSSPLQEFSIFAVIGIIGLLLNEAFMYLFTDIAGVHYTLSKLLATFLVFLWNFTARRYALFTPSKPSKGEAP